MRNTRTTIIRIHEFDGSIGFTQRGCRLKCGFCVVPKKEGKNRSVKTIADIWRGDPYPRHLHLLDNDFFGQPREQWQARVDEIIDGKFKVCLNQGINTRMIDDEVGGGAQGDGLLGRQLHPAATVHSVGQYRRREAVLRRR